MKHAWLLWAILVFWIHGANGQTLSDRASASLLTCGPGNDLYSTFGHTALAISDPLSGIDRVYNYGTFDFDTPNFYLKFARGQLLYSLNVTDSERFLRAYAYEGRWVKRQVLNLTFEEIQALYDFLENNALPENKDYHYDFFYDNCSTRPREALESILGEKLVYPENPVDTAFTFREILDRYTLPHHPWSDLGIDLALGQPCDVKTTWTTKMFLPDYLMKHMRQAEILRNGQWVPLVGTESVVLDSERVSNSSVGGILWIFWTLFGIVFLISLFTKAPTLRWFDAIFFLVIGLLGIFVLLLWFATDHGATKWNWNILWALPSWIWAAVYTIRNVAKPRFYRFHALWTSAIALFWVAIPQDFHAAVVPIILILVTRSWSWSKVGRAAEKPY